MEPIKHRLGYFGIALLVFLTDQASKFWAYTALRTTPGETLPVVEGCFNLKYAENPGIAFSIFGDAPPAMRWVLLTMAFLAATGVTIYKLRTALHERWLLVTLSLILGGILGNALDRITYGAVIDFLHVYWRDYHWPIFNLADSAICCGAAMLGIDLFRTAREETPQPADKVAG